MKPSSPVWKRGAVAGLLGAATVAAWFLALDVNKNRRVELVRTEQ